MNAPTLTSPPGTLTVTHPGSETRNPTIVHREGENPEHVTAWTKQPEHGWTTLTGWPASPEGAAALDDALECHRAAAAAERHFRHAAEEADRAARFARSAADAVTYQGHGQRDYDKAEAAAALKLATEQLRRADAACRR